MVHLPVIYAGGDYALRLSNSHLQLQATGAPQVRTPICKVVETMIRALSTSVPQDLSPYQSSRLCNRTSYPKHTKAMRPMPCSASRRTRTARGSRAATKLFSEHPLLHPNALPHDITTVGARPSTAPR